MMRERLLGTLNTNTVRWTMNKLLFGTAGIPIKMEKRNTLEGIRQVRKLGLECMELEFVRQVNITKQKAPDVKKTAEENNIILTCHGQYYINLNSLDKEKKSKRRKGTECGKNRMDVRGKISNIPRSIPRRDGKNKGL